MMKKLFIPLLFIATTLAFGQSGSFEKGTYSVTIKQTKGNNVQIQKQITELNSFSDIEKILSKANISKSVSNKIMGDFRNEWNPDDTYTFETNDGKNEIEFEVASHDNIKSALYYGTRGDDEVVFLENNGKKKRIETRVWPGVGEMNWSGKTGEKRPFLGVSIEGNDNTGNYKGVKVVDVVKGEAAANAGIKEGDVITELNGKPTPSPSLFLKTVRELEPGKSTSITYYRGGQRKTGKALVGEKENTFNFFTPSDSGQRLPEILRNYEFGDLPQLKEYNLALGLGGGYLGISGDDSDDDGVVISEVHEDTAAEKLGLKEGDVITSFDGKTVKGMKELSRLVREKKAGEKVTVEYKRKGSKKKGTVELGKRENMFVMPHIQGLKNMNMERFKIDPQDFNLDELDFDFNFDHLMDEEGIDKMIEDLEKMKKELKQKKSRKKKG